MARNFLVSTTEDLGQEEANLLEICLFYTEEYGLSIIELELIVNLQPGESFSNEDLVITRSEDR